MIYFTLSRCNPPDSFQWVGGKQPLDLEASLTDAAIPEGETIYFILLQ